MCFRFTKQKSFPCLNIKTGGKVVIKPIGFAGWGVDAFEKTRLCVFLRYGTLVFLGGTSLVSIAPSSQCQLVFVGAKKDVSDSLRLAIRSR